MIERVEKEQEHFIIEPNPYKGKSYDYDRYRLLLLETGSVAISDPTGEYTKMA
ncbi:hypothetical protein [Streptococcus sp. E17BB]|uniref:hypothetical protein n=1 Tax=Streptococcus sp. E17BB TaxID=3278714 RepID=UPI00359D9BAA